MELRTVLDTDFEEILKFIDKIPNLHKKNRRRLRIFFEAIAYINRTGCQWRLLPTYYGSWRAVHKRFTEWSKRNIWEGLFKWAQKDPDMSEVMADSTVIRAHACAAGYRSGKEAQNKEALGRSKGGFSTKIHALTEALGLPLKFILTPGQRNDITQAKPLCSDVYDAIVNADKAYDCDDFVENLLSRNCTPNIPPRSNRKKPRKYDEDIYKERSLIECFFGKIKHFRRISSRYDKSADSYLSFLNFTSVLIWLR